jgi:hypothetical protein
MFGHYPLPQFYQTTMFQKMEEVKRDSTPLGPFKELVSKSGSLKYETESKFDS